MLLLKAVVCKVLLYMCAMSSLVRKAVIAVFCSRKKEMCVISEIQHPAVYNLITTPFPPGRHLPTRCPIQPVKDCSQRIIYLI